MPAAVVNRLQLQHGAIRQPARLPFEHAGHRPDPCTDDRRQYREGDQKGG